MKAFLIHLIIYNIEMNSSKKNHSKILKMIRVCQGLSQTELAHRVGSYQPVISLVENGLMEASEDLKKRLCEELNVSKKEVFSSE